MTTNIPNIDIQNLDMPFPEMADRVRCHTSSKVNQQLDQDMVQRIRSYADQSSEIISQRIQDLNREWDTERVLEANASVLAFAGLLLGIFINSNWFWLPGIVLPFLFQHAVQGWCPPLPVIRRLGVRTLHEINREKFALKILRGDMPMIPPEADAETRARLALQAALPPGSVVS